MHVYVVPKLKENYKIDASKVRCYFHYLPTFFHLHVHFDHISASHAGVGVAKAVMFDDVIDWLQQDSAYFSKVRCLP
jgi:m7GpppX diphosphatase